MKPRVLLVVSLATLWLTSQAAAQDYVNNEFHFAMTFPREQGWAPPEVRTASSGVLVRPQELVLVASRRSGEKVTVQILDVGDGVSLEDAGYREGFRDGTVKSFPPTVRLASENVATFAGIPSYEMLIGGTIQNLPINVRMVAIVANRLQYNVSGYASQAASLTDGDLARVLSTFRFTEPPRAPGPPSGARAAGEMAGRAAAYAAMAIVLALLVRMALKRRKAA